MKASYRFILLAAHITGALSVPSPATDCGTLGVIDKSALPAGVDPGAVRDCLEHPLGEVKKSQALVERDCWNGKPVGCTKGYCWKTCGEGPWCWTAANDGYGAWYTCQNDGDCQDSFACSQKANGCDTCGCSC